MNISMLWPCKHPRGKGEQGFTLTEVLVAIVVFSIGLLGLSAMTIATIKGLSFSKKLTTATTLSQDKMEEIKHADYASIDTANYPLEDYQMITAYPQFAREVSITTNTPSPDTKTIIVTTSWKRKTDVPPYNVTIKTIIKK